MPPIPGLPGAENLTEFERGGEASDWIPIEQTRSYTNAFVVADGTRILLGHKKRGFGMKYINGFGGKVEVSETSAVAATRELKEEAGIDAVLEHAGILLFMTESTDWAFHIDIYRASSYTGQPIETDEMRPVWYPLSSIPYEGMWESDKFWFPFLLSKRYFEGRGDFRYNATLDTYELRKWWYGTPECALDNNSDALDAEPQLD